MRARWHREDADRGTYQIVVDEIPYQVQKAKLIESIAELIMAKKLPLLDDIHDEFTEDIRIVLVPKSRTVEPEILMEQLFRQTDLESRIPLNMNVLDKGLIPRVMSLKDALPAFVDHRRKVLERRSAHRLEKIAARLEVLEGYLAVYLNLDKVIKIIRTEDEPKPKLIKAFKLTETQAEAILNMRLRCLRKLEEMEIRREHSDLTKEQKELKKLLGSEKLKTDKLIEEVREIDAKFGQKTELGKRRTEFAKAAEIAKFQAIAEEVVALETAVEREPITVVCSQKGWLRALKGHQEPCDAIKYPRGRPRPLLDPCRDHRQADAVRDRWALLHAGLREAAGRTRQWRGHPHLHRSAAGGRSRRCFCAHARAQAPAGGDLRPWLRHDRRRCRGHEALRQAGHECAARATRPSSAQRPRATASRSWARTASSWSSPSRRCRRWRAAAA